MNKILYITNSINGPGGLERVLSIKASYLTDILGYEVHIVTLFKQETDIFYQFSTNIIFHALNVNVKSLIYPFSYISKINSFLKINKPDIISVCDDGLKGLLLPFLTGNRYKMIYERHVSTQVEFQPNGSSIFQSLLKGLKLKLMNFGGSKFDKFIVLTEGNKNEWHLDNIEVIPNPLSFYPDKSNVSKLNNKTVIAVGKQSFQKGYDRLLKAWSIVINEHNDWKLEIYGTKDESQGLDALARDLNIDKNITFHEPIKDIGSVYQNASIYAMSSRYEGFGMVLTEAMSYGIPCIAYDCPYGPADIIINDKNGILIENGDIMKFANSISFLIKNESVRKLMGEQARSSVENYLPKYVCGKWHQLFLELSR